MTQQKVSEAITKIMRGNSTIFNNAIRLEQQFIHQVRYPYSAKQNVDAIIDLSRKMSLEIMRLRDDFVIEEKK